MAKLRNRLSSLVTRINDEPIIEASSINQEQLAQPSNVNDESRMEESTNINNEDGKIADQKVQETYKINKSDNPDDIRAWVFLLCLMIALDGPNSYSFYMVFYYSGLPFSVFYGWIAFMLVYVSYLCCCTFVGRKKIGNFNVDTIIERTCDVLGLLCLIACAVDYKAEQESIMPWFVSLVIMRLSFEICYLCYVFIIEGDFELF